jgi:DNA-binding NarL/FixJ family response regulator
MDGRLRIAIIHSNRLAREGLALLLSQQQDLSVVITIAELDHLLGETEELYLDVILMAPSRPGQDSSGVTRQLHDAFPKAKILIMGFTGQGADVLACIEAGAVGYLPREASLEDLLNNIRAVVSGEALFLPKIAGCLFSRLEERARRWERLWDPNLSQLTRREREIVALIGEGLSNKEIAVRLGIEVPTVKNHVHNILGKLQLATRREVAYYVNPDYS